MSDSAPKKPAKSIPHGTVFDVKRPGRVPIQQTSRPVIVGHKSIVRDPMTNQLPSAKQRPDVHPLSVMSVRPAAVPQQKPAVIKADNAATPELAAIVAELASRAEPPKPTPAVTAAVVLAPKTPLGSRGGAPQDFISGATTPIIPPEPVKKQAPLSPEMKRQMEEEVQNNPNAPEPDGVVVYGDHGPIDFAKVLLWCVSVIVLVIVVGDVLLDAGVITTSVNIPHTHFIK